MASFQLPVHPPLPLFPNIGKPEVIGSSVGLVPTNALVLTEPINPRIVATPAIGPEW